MSNPVRKVPPPKRRAYTPEEAGRLLGRTPLSWWDQGLDAYSEL